MSTSQLRGYSPSPESIYQARSRRWLAGMAVASASVAETLQALVTGTRQGKNTVYALYDDHVAMLLDEAVYHSGHLRLGIRDEFALPEETAPAG